MFTDGIAARHMLSRVSYPHERGGPPPTTQHTQTTQTETRQPHHVCMVFTTKPSTLKLVTMSSSMSTPIVIVNSMSNAEVQRLSPRASSFDLVIVKRRFRGNSKSCLAWCSLPRLASCLVTDRARRGSRSSRRGWLEHQP